MYLHVMDYGPSLAVVLAISNGCTPLRNVDQFPPLSSPMLRRYSSRPMQWCADVPQTDVFGIGGMRGNGGSQAMQEPQFVVLVLPG